MADNIFQTDSKNDSNGRAIQNIPDIVSNAAKSLAHELSGIDTISKKKLIDNVISFVGLGGGAGASTVVANMATLLNKQGFSVLVIDTNIMYPIQHSLFSIKQAVDKNDLYKCLTGECTLGESIEYKNKALGIMVANNRTLINHVETDDKEASTTMLEILDRVCNLFDVVLIDASLKIEYDIVNTCLYKSDYIYGVMDESVECLSNYTRLKNALQDSGIDSNNMHVIMNKRTNIFYPDIFKQFDMDLIGMLPFDTAIIESGLRGEIFCDKGASASKNATIFIKNLKEIKDKMLELGGYMSEKK